MKEATLFLSRDLETKETEYKNIFKRHINKEVQITDVVLMDKSKAVNKVKNGLISESYDDIDKYYEFHKKGDMIGITEEGVGYKFNNEDIIVPAYLFDAVKYRVKKKEPSLV